MNVTGGESQSDAAVELDILQQRTIATVKELADVYKSTYDHVFFRSEALLQRALETGDTTAGTIALIQMLKAMDLAWKNFSTVGVQHQFEGFLTAACEKLALIPGGSTVNLRGLADSGEIRAVSLKDFVQKLPIVSLAGSLVSAPPSQQRMAVSAVTQSAFCPDIHSLYDVHHPSQTLYATDLDRVWDPVRDLTFSTLRFLQSTLLSEVQHDQKLYGAHIRFTIVHLMGKMGFSVDDVEAHAVAIDTQFFMRISADEELCFLARDTPKLSCFPGEPWYQLMQLFIKGRYGLFGSLQSNAADGESWINLPQVKLYARSVFDILKNWRKIDTQPRYTILHAINFLQTEIGADCSMSMYAGTPLPVNKCVIEIQRQFLSDIQSIPVLGEFISCHVGSCNGEIMTVRAYPLQLRMTMVAHIKRMMYRMELTPKTPAVFCSSGVFNRKMLPPKNLDNSLVLRQAYLKWLLTSPFANEYQSNDFVSESVETTVDAWFERGWVDAKNRFEEVNEELVQRACFSRLGRGDADQLSDRIKRVANLLIEQKRHMAQSSDSYKQHTAFDPAEVLDQLLASQDGFYEYRQQALYNISKIIDTDVGSDGLTYALGESSLRPATTFYKELQSVDLTTSP
jgi:hypothetical protein